MPTAAGYDVAAVRREFPAAGRFLYFDSAHQAPLATSVQAAFHAFLEEGLLAAGPKPVWLARVPAVREQVARLIGADAGEIAFTHNTSEGLNIAANALPLEAGDNVVIVEGDHPNNLYAWLNLRRRGTEVRFVSPRGGPIDAGLLAPAVDGRTRAVSLSHVWSDTGERAQLAGIGTLCRERGVPLVVDAIQSLGILPIDVRAMGISVLASGCHKGLLVPQGLGILYVDGAIGDLMPHALAASSMVKPVRTADASVAPEALKPGAARFETGNLNLPHVHALGAALSLLERAGIDRISEHVLQLADMVVTGLERLGVALIGPREPQRRSHVLVVDLPWEEWRELLAAERVRVSQQRGGIRVSLALFNTEADVHGLLHVIEAGLRRSRR